MHEPEPLYSLKMRASRQERHISGAEKILPASLLPCFLDALLKRAMHHANGEPDFINFKVEKLAEEKIIHLKALPVSSVIAETPSDGLRKMRDILESMGIRRSAEIVQRLQSLRGMRGAMLLDADSLEDYSPDQERGVRATRMDSDTPNCTAGKNHFAEALVLATKVANAPGIIAELCISDDPDYVTGYIAARSIGYVRISPLKTHGNPAGGRIFLYRGRQQDVHKTIDFLESVPAIISA